MFHRDLTGLGFEINSEYEKTKGHRGQKFSLACKHKELELKIKLHVFFFFKKKQSLGRGNQPNKILFPENKNTSGCVTWNRAN